MVELRALLAKATGIDGVVCSPLEAARVRQILGDSALVVTPGVRAAGPRADDQLRTATAYAAVLAGASHVVVGRPILQAPDPVAVTRVLLDEIVTASDKQRVSHA